MASNAKGERRHPQGGHVSIAELARRQGVSPITSVDDLVRPGTFESDDELDDFLTDLYESRQANA